MIVLDASVILKWVLDEEPQGRSARSYRDGHLTGINPIVVPELLYYEIASALGAKTSLTSEDAINGFNAIVEMELESHSLQGENFVEAIQMARQFKISLYDSSYIALAKSLACDFITADEALVKRVKTLSCVKLLR
jgi:predicted nucleic acid-binding protein